jgi:hypothetical protein
LLIRRAITTALALALVALAAVAAPGAAVANPKKVIQDCAEDGDLDRSYSNRDLRRAERDLPADLAEYSDCSQVIDSAITGGSARKGKRPGGPGGSAGGLAGGGGGAPGGGSAPSGGAAPGGAAAPAGAQPLGGAGPAAPGSLRPLKEGEKPSVRVGGETVKPGGNGLFNLATAANGLPATLLLTLVAVALLAAGGGAYALRPKLPALARVPGLSRVRLPRLRR